MQHIVKNDYHLIFDPSSSMELIVSELGEIAILIMWEELAHEQDVVHQS